MGVTRERPPEHGISRLSTPQPTELDLAKPLLRHLREVTHTPDLAYRTPPARILGGNETLIYGFELRLGPKPFRGPLIMRAYIRWDRRPGQWFWEEAIHNTLAAQGFPIPRVLHVHENAGLGSPFVIMERVPGRVMGGEILSTTQLLLSLPRLYAEIPRTLADVQLRLHAVDPAQLRQRLEDPALPSGWHTIERWLQKARTGIERHALPGLRPGLAWLEEHVPAAPAQPVICHGDFHPLNILRHDGQVTGVVDWSKVVIAEPEFDVGNTYALLSLVRINLPAALQPAARWLTRRMARSYLRLYGRTRALDSTRLLYYQILRALVELANYNAHLADAQTIEGAGDAGGWDYPRLRTFVEAHTGVRIAHPAAP